MPETAIRVEVVYARPDEQVIVVVELPCGADVESALAASGLYRRYPDQGLEQCATGIWGRLVARDAVIRDGDRVELYRPLRVEPRDARRQRAVTGRGS